MTAADRRADFRGVEIELGEFQVGLRRQDGRLSLFPLALHSIHVAG